MSWRDVAVTSAEQALTNLPKPPEPDEASPSQDGFGGFGGFGAGVNNVTEPPESKKEDGFGGFGGFGARDDFFTLSSPIHGQNSLQPEVLTEPPKLPKPPAPALPLQPGWIVAYRDQQGRLSGGWDDRARGTVAACERVGGEWAVLLVDGSRLPLTAVLSVGKTDAAGRVISAWSVRGAGLDGEGGSLHATSPVMSDVQSATINQEERR